MIIVITVAIIAEYEGLADFNYFESNKMNFLSLRVRNSTFSAE